MKKFVKLSIKAYRYTASIFFIGSCRFTPSCSSYALEAVEKYGSMKGSWLAFKRVLKCHPFHPGGADNLN